MPLLDFAVALALAAVLLGALYGMSWLLSLIRFTPAPQRVIPRVGERRAHFQS